MTSGSVYGHAAAILTVLIWGTTFISTKVLLAEFQPVELLFFRFVLGYLALWAACPRRLKLTRRRQELYFAAAGLCGVTLYFFVGKHCPDLYPGLQRGGSGGGVAHRYGPAGPTVSGWGASASDLFRGPGGRHGWGDPPGL